jgi:hypothetical protein
MNKKISGIVAAGIIAIAALNMRLNTQNIISDPLLVNVEALAIELTAEERAIILHGLLSKATGSSSAPFSAVNGYSYVKVYYLASLNNITVRVVSSSGQTVYLNNVNPVAGGQLIINLVGAPSGEYIITFSGFDIGTVYGTFNI